MGTVFRMSEKLIKPFRKHVARLVFQTIRLLMSFAPGEMELFHKEYFPQRMKTEKLACFPPSLPRHLAAFVSGVVHIPFFLQLHNHLAH